MERSSTDERIDQLTSRVGRFEGDVKECFDRVDRRFDKVDAKFEQVDERFDARFDKVDTRFDTVLTKEVFEKAEEARNEQMGRLEARFDRWGKIMGGGVVTMVGTVVAAAAAKVFGL